jgi:two-component system response regulator FixJ
MSEGKPDQPVVFVVDDDEGFRNALLRLCRIDGLRAEAFASAEAYLEAYCRDAPGCLLLDVKMPGMDGLELQTALAAHHITLPVIFMTGAADVNMVIQAMKAGAMDFIEKPFETASLLTLVRAAIERDARQRQATDQHAGAAQKLALLTGREREIFDHVIQGKPSKVIARELGISYRTVEIHRSRILSKTNARSVAELIRITDKAGESFVQA